ncbi:hypothetical protein TNIN_479651 [Trichonephila inaurata madagascariensis]|uniref:Uncharacterized protein n=1 Tax=Trichonephila inaurata madagascariensis TaxID=2747483 RepID=A0A8X6WXD7_9ARAC|nr:hypothetical protein TNIN_479651 [Trichonephila inaurata madagascariensis]
MSENRVPCGTATLAWLSSFETILTGGVRLMERWRLTQPPPNTLHFLVLRSVIYLFFLAQPPSYEVLMRGLHDSLDTPRKKSQGKSNSSLSRILGKELNKIPCTIILPFKVIPLMFLIH